MPRKTPFECQIDKLICNARDEGVQLSVDHKSKNDVWVKVPDCGKRNDGLGSKVMQQLCAIADEHGETLTLTASASGKCGPTTEMLIEWYQRISFDIDPNCGSPHMIRTPAIGSGTAV